MRSGLLLLACLLLPLPVRAADPLPVTEVAPGVFLHQGRQEDATAANGGDIANIGFIVGGAAVAVIDSGGSMVLGRGLLAAIRQRTDLPVRYVINTHMHPDHVLGNAAFRDPGTSLVAHGRLPAALAARFDTYRARQADSRTAGDEVPAVLPVDIAVTDSRDLDLGGRVLRLTAWPTAHTNNDLTVLDTATGTLWTGDLLFRDRHPSLDGSLLGWLRVMDDLAAVPARTVVPGHGPPGPWPAALEPQRTYLRTVAEEVRTLQRRGVGLAEAVPRTAAETKTRWLLFETYHPQLITAAYAELEWE
ncbi:quinoprotein relay system zinc metallohydrolase 2 [Oleisolibacter albus]|uniref:quinoprotein relay system zinc metallohydrolase 2 n=1 Tax=Oleisolibacter albus TaxID=2171757 RepID=UPI000DF2801C|nr:quinoprotein relay system zinc metallohydrolase 2 [Oleisolibacter albus]